MVGDPGHYTGRKAVHRWIYIIGLGLLVVALPSSVFLMSLSQIILFVNWLAEGQFREKFQRFFSHRPALVFVSIYLVHVVFLFHSSNFDYGLGTLESRLPVLLFPLLVVSSAPLSPKVWRWIMLAFSSAVTVVSLCSLYIFFTGDYAGYRELSPFISHIRLSLMVALSVFLLIYLGYHYFSNQRQLRIICLALAAWHVVYLVMLQSLTGIVVFSAVLLVIGVQHLIRGSISRRVAGLSVMAAVFAGMAILTTSLWQGIQHKEEMDLSSLDTHSAAGTPYLHDRQAPYRENGHLVYIYIAEEELREAWNSRSDLDFDGNTDRGDPLKHVLYRYMASRGLRKDSAGLAKLGAEEIEAVEGGVANVRYNDWPWVVTRMHQSLWELEQFRLSGDPTGHTLAMRLEFWEAALLAIKEKPIFGWGTGDIREASAFGLDQSGSALEFERWMKPHNQYLSFTVLFGIPAALWILFAMIWPALRMQGFRFLPFTAFFVILMVSMINEDTIDTQAGLSFFVFFYTMLLFGRREKIELGGERIEGRG
ncbi:MAG: O-antigen ligase family protein [Bacteroidales bacterium]